MKAAMVKRQPHKIDIGAVFNLPPKVRVVDRGVNDRKVVLLRVRVRVRGKGGASSYLNLPSNADNQR